MFSNVYLSRFFIAPICFQVTWFVRVTFDIFLAPKKALLFSANDPNSRNLFEKAKKWMVIYRFVLSRLTFQQKKIFIDRIKKLMQSQWKFQEKNVSQIMTRNVYHANCTQIILIQW